MFEAEYGEVVRSRPIRHRVPVDAYLRIQQRFAHLFAGGIPDQVRIDRIQAICDRNIERYHLLRSEEVPS